MSCNGKHETEVKKLKANYTDSLKISYSKGREDGFNAGLSMGVEALNDSTAKYAEDLATVQAALDDCLKGKKAPKKNKPINKPVAPQQKAPIVTKSDQFVPPTQQTVQKPKQQVPAPQQAVSTNTATPASGLITDNSGHYMFKTVAEDGVHLKYVIVRSFYDEADVSGIPELSDRGSGKRFTMSLDGQRWEYIDMKVIVTDSYLLQVGCEPWTAYVGDERGYPTFLPHQWLKTYIEQARGNLSGNITQEDVKNIAKLVPEVANGLFRPNKVRKTNENYANNDGLYYEGWSVCSQLIYRKK